MIERYRYLNFWDEIKESDNLFWTVGSIDSSLFLIDHKENLVRRICRLPRQGKFVENRFCYMVEIKNKIIAIPQNCFQLGVYDKDKKEMMGVDVHIDTNWFGYSALKGFEYNDKGIIFSSKAKHLPIILNLDDLKVDWMRKWEDFMDEINGDNARYVCANIDRYGEGIIFGKYNSNQVLYFDLKNQKGFVIDKFPSNISIFKTYVDKNTIFAIPLNENCIYIKELGRESTCRKISVSKKTERFVTMLFDDKELVLIPQNEPQIYIINRATEDYCIVECDRKRINNLYNEGIPSSFFKGRMDQSNIFLYPCRTDKLVKVNRTTLQPEYINIFVSRELDYDDLKIECFCGYDGDIFFEKEISLNKYVEGVVKGIV